jgi:hypothetical protein
MLKPVNEKLVLRVIIELGVRNEIDQTKSTPEAQFAMK